MYKFNQKAKCIFFPLILYSVGTIKSVIGGRVFMTLMAYEYSYINIIDDYEILVLITSAVPVVGA